MRFTDLLANHSNVLLAGLGFLSTVAAAYVGVAKAQTTREIARMELEHKAAELAQRDKELELAKRELTFQAEALSFGAFLEDWAGTSEAMEHLLDNTPVDRILIFKAWNGSLTPKWTTAVYQMREMGQEPVQYIHTELDRDYVDRMRQMISNGCVAFSVATVKDSLIKEVYDAEGVRSTCWAHIETRQVPRTDAMAISYISFSSCTVDELDASTITKCRILAGRLKGLANNFHSEDNRETDA
jgi:hypothetical protein